MLQPIKSKGHTAWKSGQRAGDPGTGDVVALVQRLHEQLDPVHVAKVLADEIRGRLGADGVSYMAPDGEVMLRRGRSAPRALSYQLRGDGGEPLGEWRVARARPLADAEQAEVEALLGLAYSALRNALKHRSLECRVRLDPLTGVGNRVAFTERLTEEIAHARRHDEALSLLVLDIDGFKTVNDVHGHLAGDAVLRHVAMVLNREMRGSDSAFRYAGDEFVVCARRTDAVGAERLCDRLLAAIEEDAARYEAVDIPLTVSIGIASMTHDDTAESLFRRADEAMFTCKRDRAASTPRGAR